MLRDYSNELQDPIFSETVTLDLATVVSSVSGPKRPHDRVSVSDMKQDFNQCLTNKVFSIIIKVNKKKNFIVDFRHINRPITSSDVLICTLR